MPDLIRVRVRDRVEGASLSAWLAMPAAELVEADRGWELQILDTGEPRQLKEVLSGVERWLIEQRLASATIRVADRDYTLPSPMGAS